MKSIAVLQVIITLGDSPRVRVGLGSCTDAPGCSSTLLTVKSILGDVLFPRCRSPMFWSVWNGPTLRAHHSLFPALDCASGLLLQSRAQVGWAEPWTCSWAAVVLKYPKLQGVPNFASRTSMWAVKTLEVWTETTTNIKVSKRIQPQTGLYSI